MLRITLFVHHHSKDGKKKRGQRTTEVSLGNYFLSVACDLPESGCVGVCVCGGGGGACMYV